MKKNKALIIKVSMSIFISCFYCFTFADGVSYGAEKSQTEDMQVENPVSRVKGTRFEKLTDTLKKNGELKVSNFPERNQHKSKQGTFNVKDIHDDIIMDMNLPNEAIPKNAHSFQQVGGWLPFKKPTKYNSINPWGQIFLIDGEDCPEITSIDIKNLALICYMKNDDGNKEWKVINLPNTIDGGFYPSHYNLDSTTVEDAGKYMTPNVDGVNIKMPKSIIDEPKHSRCFHFWTKPVSIGNYVENYGDIEYVIVSCEVRLNSENENIEEKKGKFVFDVGADCKTFDSKGVLQGPIQEVVGGRFKIVTDSYRRVYATDLPYNEYVNKVSEDQIDRLLYGIPDTNVE